MARWRWEDDGVMFVLVLVVVVVVVVCGGLKSWRIRRLYLGTLYLVS